MTPFTPLADGRLTAEFTALEAAMLAVLARQVASLVGSPSDDPARARLLPDAYPDDAPASDEFRRLTESDLAAGKAADAALVAATVGEGGPVVLDRRESLAWLHALTDVRLVLADRLGVRRDGDEPATGSDEEAAWSEAYHWLGWVQSSLLDALDESA